MRFNKPNIQIYFYLVGTLFS